MSLAGPPRAPLQIPIKDSDANEILMIDWAELPEHSELMKVLYAETPPLSCWLSIIAHYMRTNNDADLEQIFRDTAPPAPGETKLKGFNRHYEYDVEGRALIYNAQAVFRIKQARQLQRQFFVESAMKRDAKGTVDEKKNQALLDCLRQAEKMIKQAADTLDADKSNPTLAQAATNVTQGELILLQGEVAGKVQDSLDKALMFFNRALASRPTSLTALLNMAHVMFRKGQFKDALNYYQRVCMYYPNANAAAVRVGLGMCYYELNQESRAQECFERALQLDPTSIDAQAGLAVIELGLASEADRAVGASSDELIRNQERAKELSSRALARLENAYAKDPRHPLVLLHLANHFFHRRDYDKCENLAQDAYYYSQSRMIQAEAMYIMGRKFHEQKDFNRAYQHYHSSIGLADQANTRFSLAHFASAQMHLARGDTQLAITSVETVMDTPEGKDDEDCAMMLGTLRAKNEQADSALALLRRVTDKNPHYAEAWILQASIEQMSYRMSAAAAEDAIRSYEKAQAAYKLRGAEVPLELWNNLGALKYRLNNFQGALQAFTMAMGGATVDVFTLPIETSNVTCLYNYARTLEASGSLKPAETLYQRLRSALPDYVDATLRLACISKLRGHISEAEEFIKEVIGKNSACADAWLLYGALEIERGAYKIADKKFDHVVHLMVKSKAVFKHDEYARLCKANVAFHDAQAAGRSEKEKDDALRVALGCYRDVLTRHPTNIFAANGIGACQAVRHRIESARQIFEKVREVSDASCPSTWVNLAHTMMLEKEYPKAVIMYEQISKRFFEDRDWEMLFYLANALFHSGSSMKETRAVLLQALRLQPNEEALWFALATVDEADAVRILALDANTRSLGQVEAAVAMLERALGVFEWLSAKQASAWVAPTYPIAGPSALLPHRPATPPGEPRAEATPVLLARARCALRELQGEAPDPADSALRAESDASMQQALLENRIEARLQGHRTLLERAAHRRNPMLAKLSSAANKRFAAVKAELVASVTAQALQTRTERRQIEEKKRQEEARLAAEKRAAEEAAARQRVSELEGEALKEKVERLAKENAELITKIQQVRKSTRVRRKSQKMRESDIMKGESDSGDDSGGGGGGGESAPEDEEPEAGEDSAEDEDFDEAEMDDAQKLAMEQIKEIVASNDLEVLTLGFVRKALGDLGTDLGKKWIVKTLNDIVNRRRLVLAVKKLVAEHPDETIVELIERIDADEDTRIAYREHKAFTNDQIILAKGGVPPERRRKIRKVEDEEEELSVEPPVVSALSKVAKRVVDDDDDEEEMGTTGADSKAEPGSASLAAQPPQKKSRVIDDDDD